MKSRDGLIRLKKFQVQEKTRQLAQIDMMIAEFERMGSELERQILLEEEKSGISDTAHFAYPTFAKAARQRRENLKISVRELREQREGAQTELAEADEEVAKFQLLQERDSALQLKESDIDVLAERRVMIS